MFLEQLRDFEWYNEPADVSFDERGMRVLSRASHGLRPLLR